MSMYLRGSMQHCQKLAGKANWEICRCHMRGSGMAFSTLWHGFFHPQTGPCILDTRAIWMLYLSYMGSLPFKGECNCMPKSYQGTNSLLTLILRTATWKHHFSILTPCADNVTGILEVAIRMAEQENFWSIASLLQHEKMAESYFTFMQFTNCGGRDEDFW